MTPVPRNRRSMRFWLIVYWLGGALGGVVVVVSPIGFAFGGMDAGEVLAQILFTLGATSPVIGAILATRLHGVESLGRFLKGTSTIRVTAVTWAALPALAYLVIAILGPQNGQSVNVSAGALIDSNPEIAGLFGAANLLLLLGPGIADYRVAREEQNESAQPTSVEPPTL